MCQHLFNSPVDKQKILFSQTDNNEKDEYNLFIKTTGYGIHEYVNKLLIIYPYLGREAASGGEWGIKKTHTLAGCLNKMYGRRKER